WVLWQRLSLVERAGDPRGQRVRERRKRPGVFEIGLRVADPDLDGREGEMRPDAPPDLCVLVDRTGLVEEAHEPLVVLPAPERVGDAASREHPGEDLRARRVQIGEDALDE